MTHWSSEKIRTQVIQALLSLPKAVCHAGSNDWKYSSGWKKVLTARALTVRATRSRPRMTRSSLRPAWAGSAWRRFVAISELQKRIVFQREFAVVQRGDKETSLTEAITGLAGCRWWVACSSLLTLQWRWTSHSKWIWRMWNASKPWGVYTSRWRYPCFRDL